MLQYTIRNVHTFRFLMNVNTCSFFYYLLRSSIRQMPTSNRISKNLLAQSFFSWYTTLNNTGKYTSWIDYEGITSASIKHAWTKPWATFIDISPIHAVSEFYKFTSPGSACIGLRFMMTSNGSIFRVTGPLCGEYTGHRWISRTKTSDTELWYFLWSAPE